MPLKGTVVAEGVAVIRPFTGQPVRGDPEWGVRVVSNAAFIAANPRAGPMRRFGNALPATLYVHDGVTDSDLIRAAAHYFGRRTTKSGAGGAKPAVTAYRELPNSAIVVGTFVAGFDANGSVM